MSKIYIVTSGSYSDYHIDGVFDDESLAQAFIDSFKQDGWYDRMGIEEWELNAKGFRKGLFPYFVRFKPNSSDVETISLEGSPYSFTEDNGPSFNEAAIRGFYAYVWGTDEAHAIKIANEKRAIFLANGPLNQQQ